MIRSKIKKINPAKSNKMIYAVTGGVALVLLAFFALIILSGRGGSRSISRTLSYLKNTEGLVEIKALEAERRAVIVYNSDSKNAANFEKVAHYAAVRLSRSWPDCEVHLARNNAGRVVYIVRVKGGAIVAEEAVAAERP